MAVWTNFAALVASLASGKAFTDEKAQALAENVKAAFEGDATAVADGVTLRLPALQRLTAGTSVRVRNDAMVAGTAPVDFITVGFLQAGTVRFEIEHRVQSGGDVVEATVRRTRAGTETVMQTWTTSSTSFVARSYDATVQPGDLWVLRNRRSSGVADDVEGRNARLSIMAGEYLWPSQSVMGLIEGQTI